MIFFLYGLTPFLRLKLNGPLAVQALRLALKSTDVISRRTVLMELQRVGPSARAPASVLIQALDDPDLYIRCRSCEILGRIKADPAQVLPALMAALNSPESSVRENAAEALGAYGAEAKIALPKLLELRNSTNQLEGHLVRKALKQIDPKAAAKAGVE